MIKIDEILSKGFIQYKTEDIQQRDKLTRDEFYFKLINNIGNLIRFKNPKYDFDDYNKPIIEQLFYYYNKSTEFNGNYNKGIILAGAIGCGKTLLLTAFFNIIVNADSSSNKWMHSTDIIDYMNLVKEDSRYGARHLFIDDIGKESHDVKHYGNVIYPFEELIRKRYNSAGLMFGTTNYKMQDLKYIQHTKDRMIEMFNIIELPGKSRRK